MDPKFYLTAAILAGVLCCIGACIMVQPESDDPYTSEYSIIYILGCDADNDDNPDTYGYGEMVNLEPASFPGKYFGGWYLDRDFTRPCMVISPGTSGDITLFAKWQNDLVGRELKYTFTGNVTDGVFTHYSIWGDRTVTYLHHDAALGYYMDYRTNTTYDYGDRRYTDHDSFGEWNPEILFDIKYLGNETIDTEFGKVTCKKFTHSETGYTNEIWFGLDDDVIYKARERSETIFGNTVFSYTLVKQDFVEPKEKFSLTVHSDRGIKVTGSGDYLPGTKVVLTAEP